MQKADGRYIIFSSEEHHSTPAKMGERRIRELVGVRTKRYRGLGALASVKYVFVAPLPVYTPLDLLPLFGSNNHRPHEDWDPDGNMAGQPRF